MPVTIRSAVVDDLPALLTIEREAASAAHWSREQYEHLVESGIVLVAQEEETRTISGFASAKKLADIWEVENIVVAKHSRRRGIGGDLLEELLRHARHEGCAAVWLEVRESNLPAFGLYRKHGFSETGRRRAYYTEPVEDAVLYELRLDVGK
jgi:ribosomal-protein-alanine N-acetyltransferase